MNKVVRFVLVALAFFAVQRVCADEQREKVDTLAREELIDDVTIRDRKSVV